MNQPWIRRIVILIVLNIQIRLMRALNTKKIGFILRMMMFINYLKCINLAYNMTLG